MSGDRRPSEAYFPSESAEYGRGLSYFDAIYGFAATLLIANVDPVPADSWRDLPALVESGALDQLLGFFLSFAVIALFWRVSVRCLRATTGLDAPTTVVSLVATALIVVIPFTTQGISDPSTSALSLPTAVYAVNIALASIAHSAVFFTAARRGLLREPLDARGRRAALADAAVTPAVFVASIPIAYAAGPAMAQLTWLSLVVLLPLVGRWSQRR